MNSYQTYEDFWKLLGATSVEMYLDCTVVTYPFTPQPEPKS